MFVFLWASQLLALLAVESVLSLGGIKSLDFSLSSQNQNTGVTKGQQTLDVRLTNCE